MSWNGFPTKVRNFLIKKLKAKLCNDNNIILHENNENNDDSVPKTWLKLPYLGRQGEFLVKNLIRKIRRSLKIHVKIIAVYQTKKTPFFLPNKDKILDSNKANVVYEFSCPGCGHSYVGKTERSLETRLSEHANINSYKTSAITQHLLNCPGALYLANLRWLPTVMMFQFTYCLKVYYFFFVKVVVLKLSHHITMMLNIFKDENFSLVHFVAMAIWRYEHVIFFMIFT